MGIDILEGLKGFKPEILTDLQLQSIAEIAKNVRIDVLTALQNAGTGHPGGSLSSLDLYIMLWLCANVSPEKVNHEVRDRIVASHGHTAAGVYAVLANLGYCRREEYMDSFRKGGSYFEGHPCIRVPGVEWCSGSLGQGLSVGCGFALAARLKGLNYHVFVVMGDGEQGKGQLQEAREFAVKYRLGNLTAIVDSNMLQASGSLEDVMPQKLAQKYEAAGWEVLRIDGHNHGEIYQALRSSCRDTGKPALILAETVMGKGVPSIENKYEYHGKVLTQQQYEQALQELGCGVKALQELQCGTQTQNNGVNDRQTDKCKNSLNNCQAQNPVEQNVSYGTPIRYEGGKLIDCRSAFGNALYDLAKANLKPGGVALAALDCDLVESVKLQKLGEEFPDSLIECGIQEHNVATVAGALSKSGVLTFFADFGVFGIDETYGQHRMGDLNHTSLKLVCTHCGLDVGEDGKTHQCIDYISLMSNLFGYKIILPADANQTDRAVRYAATNPGNILIAMGRSKVPVLQAEDGSTLFSENYRLEYGKADWIREGGDCTIVTYGTMVHKAVKVHDSLKPMGIRAGVLNLSCPLEFDEEAVYKAAGTGFVVVYEDHHIRTGLGSILGTFLAEHTEHGTACKFRRVGITRYGASADPGEQYKLQGMDENSLIKLILSERM